MSGTVESSTGVTLLTPQQIEVLQQQIRQFKNLGRKFADSKIPKLIEGLQPSQPPAQNPKPTGKDSGKETAHPAKETTQTSVSTGPQSGTTAAPAQPALSWQCFNSLLFCGPNKFPQDGAISFSTSDFGCFMKSAHLPLVVTAPYAASLREKALSLAAKAKLNASAAAPSSAASPPPDALSMMEVDAGPCAGALSATESKTDDASVEESPLLWILQRQVRAALIRQHLTGSTAVTPATPTLLNAANIHPPIALGPTNYITELLAYRNFYRNRKQNRRDVKAWEKEDRRRRLELEDKRKKKALEYHKALLAHREDFFRFHKSKKFECSKAARAVKTQLESLDARKEKDEARAEMRRLQALRENDMEAYTSLVQDTKNGRLKFLLNETDSYIATINRMIQEQRVLTPEEEAAAAAEEQAQVDGLAKQAEDSARAQGISSPASGAAGAAGAGTGTTEKGKPTAASKEYYRSTHRTLETVQQPTMMKGGQLKEYQLAGLSWLISLYNNNLNGILADEMGLGKTIQTISMVCYLMEYKHNNGPFLIVVPLSTLSNWVNEFNRWAPDVLKVVYKGAPDERKRLFKDEVEAGQLNVLLTTYEYIMKDKASLRKLAWQYIIVDEGHRMKNAQSKFAQILGTVYQSRHRILLTGTPLQNDLPELWALLNFLLPTIFSSVDTFDQWFNKPFAAFRQQGAVGAAAANAADDTAVAEISQEERLLIVHRLHEVLRPFVLRRVKSQVLDQLPDKVEKVLRCNLSGWQRKMYQSIVHKGLAARKASDAPVGGLNNAIMQMRKVCNHPYLFLRDYCVDEDLVRASGKFALLDRMLPKLKAGGHRVLMFSQMVESMNFLEQFFLLRGYMFLRLDGNTSADERERRVAVFNAPDSQHFIFLLSTRAGGLGINLATADTVIIFDSDWNPMMDAQAQDRAHRIGQKKEVRVFRLLTNSPVEERILARATDKRNLNGLVVEAGRFNQRGPTGGVNNNAANAAAQAENRAMMESLLKEWSTGANMSLNEGSSGDGGSEEGGVAGPGGADQAEDDYINEVMAASEAELAVYQAIDAQYERERAEKWRTLHTSLGLPVPPLPPRLMEAHEKPLWMTEDCWPSKYAVIAKDMMSSTTVAIGARAGMVAKVAKKKGRRSNADVALDLLQQQQYGATGGDTDEWANESDGDSLASDAHVVAGKVMRKRKDVQYDDGMTDLQYTRYLEKQHDLQEAAQVKETAKATQAANTVFHELTSVVTSIQKIKREDGSQLAAIFLDKPPKAIYPDYYQLIAQPIALKQILQKLKKFEYTHFEGIEQDFALMCHNARTYNLDTSPVYSDSEVLRREFYTRSAPVLRKFGIASAEYLSLPPFSHLVYPVDYIPRRVLSATAVAEAGGDAYGSDGDAAMDVEDYPSAAPPSGKKGKAAGVRRKRASMEDGGAGAATPGAAPAKKRARVSTGEVSGFNYADSFAAPSGTSALSISLKKPAMVHNPSVSSLADAGADSEGGEPLFLSFSLKGRR